MQFIQRILILATNYSAKHCYGKHDQFALEKMTKAEIKRMIRRLNNAYVSCKECGTEWGVYSVGCSSTWMGVCQICEQRKPVTESRDYAYFYTGIHKLQQQLTELS